MKDRLNKMKAILGGGDKRLSPGMRRRDESWRREYISINN